MHSGELVMGWCKGPLALFVESFRDRKIESKECSEWDAVNIEFPVWASISIGWNN